MRKGLMTAALAALFLGVSVAPAMAGPPRKGDQMPALKVGEVYNNEFELDLQDLKGYVVVVEFWATWCGPCKVSIPHLNALHERYKDDGVVMIGLSDEAPGTVNGFMKNTEMNYIVVAGSTSKGDYGVRGIPNAFVVDATGKVVWSGHPMDEQFEQSIEQALASTPPTRRLGSGPAFNERMLSNMETALSRGDHAEAVKGLARIDVKSLPEKEGHQSRFDALQSKIESIAKTEFDRAETNYRDKEYIAALDGFETIAKNFRGLDVADRAADRVKELNRDPEVQAARRSSAVDRLADNALKRAESLAERGMDVLAYKKLQSIVEKYPNTDAAQAAQEKIDAYQADAEFMKKLNEDG